MTLHAQATGLPGLLTQGPRAPGCPELQNPTRPGVLRTPRQHNLEPSRKLSQSWNPRPLKGLNQSWKPKWIRNRSQRRNGSRRQNQSQSQSQSLTSRLETSLKV